MKTFLAMAFYTLAALVMLLLIGYIVDDFNPSPPAFIKSEMVQDAQEMIIVLCIFVLALYCFLRGAFFMANKRAQKPKASQSETQPITALVHINRAIAALESAQQALGHASKMIDEQHGVLRAYTRTAIADCNCARGRLEFLQDRLSQEKHN